MTYNATIMISLRGAMDNWDALIPYDDPTYALWANKRGALLPLYDAAGFPRTRAALASTALTPLNAGPDALPPGREWALSPQMPDIAALFNAGNASIVADIGPLTKPNTTGADRADGVVGVDYPFRLASHNDQQSLVENGALEGAQSGVAGRLMQALSEKESLSPVHGQFDRVSTGFQSTYLAGGAARPYNIGRDGSPPDFTNISGIVFPGRGDSSANLSDVSNMHPVLGMLLGPHQPENGPAITEPHYAPRGLREASAQQGRDEAAERGRLYRALQAEDPPAPNQAFAPGDPTANNTVNQNYQGIINNIVRGASETLLTGGLRHQFFHMQFGGFDTHTRQAEELPPRQTVINDVVKAFWDDLVLFGLQNNVLIYIQGEFGRSAAPNGTGTDHAWGNYHFLVRGGMQGGGRIVGGAPLAPDYNSAVEYDPAHPQFYNRRGWIVPRHDVSQGLANIGAHHGLTGAEMAAGVNGSAPAFPNLGLFGATADAAVLPVV